MPVCVELFWLDHGLGLLPPERKSEGAAGLDLRAALGADDGLELEPGARSLVPCGFAMALPHGFEAQVRPRSGLALKFGVTVLNTPGTIDADYRGEVQVLLINLGQDTFTIKRGDRIAQMVIAPVASVELLVVDKIDATLRGTNGFGSTGAQD